MPGGFFLDLLPTPENAASARCEARPRMRMRMRMRMRVPLDANVLRRRPVADASPLISHPGGLAPAFRLAGGPIRARQAPNFPASLQSDRPGVPAGLRGEIKEEACAARRMPEDIHPEGLPAAPGPARGQRDVQSNKASPSFPDRKKNRFLPTGHGALRPGGSPTVNSGLKPQRRLPGRQPCFRVREGFARPRRYFAQPSSFSRCPWWIA